MEDYQTKYLFPGELFFDIKPYKITTILGSCVSVTLFNKKRKIGGINHFLLAESNLSDDVNDNKYGNCAMKNLIEIMFRIDHIPLNYEAKIFGGGKVIDSIIDFKIGINNIFAARKILKEYGITVTSECVDNNYGIKVIFFNFNNNVVISAIK
ncbi:chemotaxis protein CheD [Candidatus Dependentiae bacterium]|nr:chemotaxis protein CheD [Candidatus Dependentiae bacterium]